MIEGLKTRSERAGVPVALLGGCGVGKSTLINNLIGQPRIARSVSPRLSFWSALEIMLTNRTQSDGGRSCTSVVQTYGLAPLNQESSSPQQPP